MIKLLVRNRHIENNKDYNVDEQYLKTLWDEQERKCAVTGVLLVLESKVTNPNYSASLDRKDSSLGYMRGNLQWISVTTNHAKNRFDETVILEYIDIIQNLL